MTGAFESHVVSGEREWQILCRRMPSKTSLKQTAESETDVLGSSKTILMFQDQSETFQKERVDRCRRPQ